MMCDVLCEGFLTKSPPFNQPRSRWCKRYFILDSESLLYYKDSTKLSLKGGIQLNGILEVKIGSEHAVKNAPKECNTAFAFELLSEERTYVLISESREMVKMWINCLTSVLSKDLKDGSSPDTQAKSKQKRKESVVDRIIQSIRPRTCPELPECSEPSESGSSFQDKYRPDSTYSSQGGFEEEESVFIPTSNSVSSFRSSDSAISTSSQPRVRLTDNLPKTEPILDPESQKAWILRNNKQAGLKIDTTGLPSERILNPIRSPTSNTWPNSKLEIDIDMTRVAKRLSEANFNSLSDELTPVCSQGNQDVFFSVPSSNPPREVESFYDYPKNNSDDDIYDIPSNLKIPQHLTEPDATYDIPKFNQHDEEMDGMYSCSKEFQQDETIYDSPKLYHDDESIYDSPKNVIKNDESIYDSPKSAQEETYDSPKQLKADLPSSRVSSLIQSDESSPHSSNTSLPNSRNSFESSEDIYDIPKPKLLLDESDHGTSLSSEKSLLEMIDESFYDTPKSFLTPASSASRNTPPATEDESLEGFYDTPSNILKPRSNSSTVQSITRNNSQLEALILDDLYDTPRRPQNTNSNTSRVEALTITPEISSSQNESQSIQELNDSLYDIPCKPSPPSRPAPIAASVTLPRGLPPPRLPPRSASESPDRSSTILPNKPPPLPNRNSATLPHGFVAAPPQRPLPIPSSDLVELSRTGPVENVGDRTLTREKRQCARESQLLTRNPQIPLNYYVDIPGPVHPVTDKQSSPKLPSRDSAIPDLPERSKQQVSNTNPFLPPYRNPTPNLNFCKEVQEVFDQIDVDNSPGVLPKHFTGDTPSNNVPKYPVVQMNLATGQSSPKYPVIKNTLTTGQLSPKYPSMVKVKQGYQNVTDVKGALNRGDSNQGTAHKKLHKRESQAFIEDTIGYMPMKPPSERVSNPGPALRPTRTPPIPVPSIMPSQVNLPEDPYSYEKMESPEKRLLGNPNYRTSLQHHQNAVTMDRSMFSNQNPQSYLPMSRSPDARNQTLPSRPVPRPAFQSNPPEQHMQDRYDQMSEPGQDYLQMNPNDQTDYLPMNPNDQTDYLPMNSNDPTDYLNFEGAQPGEYLQMGANDPAEYLNFESNNHSFNAIQFEDAHQSDF